MQSMLALMRALQCSGGKCRDGDLTRSLVVPKEWAYRDIGRTNEINRRDLNVYIGPKREKDATCYSI